LLPSIDKHHNGASPGYLMDRGALMGRGDLIGTGDRIGRAFCSLVHNKGRGRLKGASGGAGRFEGIATALNCRGIDR
jgi:hypothetical protein